MGINSWYKIYGLKLIRMNNMLYCLELCAEKGKGSHAMTGVIEAGFE